MKTKAQISSIIFFLALASIVSFSVGQEILNSTSDNSSIIENITLNETVQINESNITGSDLTNESNNTEDNEIMPPPDTNLSPVVDTFPPIGLPETNSSNQLPVVNDSSNQTSITIPPANGTINTSLPPPDIELNLTVPELPAPTEFRIKAGETGRIALINEDRSVEWTEIRVRGVNTQDGFAIVSVNDVNYLVEKGKSFSLNGKTIQVLDIPFIEFKKIPESEIVIEVEE